MTNHNETKLPFKEGDSLEYENTGKKMKMTVRTIMKSLGWIWVDNGHVGSEWGKLMIDDVLERINDGLFVVREAECH